MSALGAADPSAYWYLARGTGIVSLILLTLSVAVGISGAVRFAAPPRWPRFAIDALHRDVSLLVIVLLIVHIATSVLDKFAPIKLVDAVIPLSSSYRPLWLGLGALSFDLLVALAVTSLLRRRLGYGLWRTVHWIAYVSWPVAVLHGLGTGSDIRTWWMLALTLACAAAVLGAVWVRLASGHADARVRAPALALSLVVPIGLAAFALIGPLSSGWARRAGTPAKLLAGGARIRVSGTSAGAAAAAGSGLRRPFSAHLAGRITQTPEPAGSIVDLALRVTGGLRGSLRIRLAGAPLPGGGLSMTGSQVDLAAAGLPSVLGGRIVQLQGQALRARVTDAAGSSIDLHATLNIAGDSVNGSLSGTPGGSR